MEEQAPLSKQFKSEKKFLVEENNKKYEITFRLNDSSININLKDVNSFPQLNYVQFFSFEKILDLSKVFKIYDNLSEIYDNIIIFMEKKKYSIETRNSSIFLIFNFDLGSISFELFAKKNNIDDTLNYLTEKVKYLMEENIEIKNKLNLYFQENNNLKNKIISLENEINYFKEKENYKLFYGSTIIQSFEEKNLISNWILQNTDKNCRLIYKAKRDGDQALDFHSKCDNMGPLLIIIQTSTGNRFGGYTSKSWTNPSSSNWPGDELAFIFSLDLKRKFEIKIPSQAIGHYNDKGPVFGYGHCFEISSGCLHNSSSYHRISASYEGMDQLILTKQSKFTVSDYEVFQIKFL